jgi:transposase
MGKLRRTKWQRRGAGRHSANDDVQLSRHDLSQLDEAYLSGLGEVRLRALSVKLLADLKAAHERLEQNSRNSSRPPSSEAPWEGAQAEEASTKVAGRDKEGNAPGDAEDKDGQKESKPSKDGTQESAESNIPQEQRRAGQRPGAPGHGRTQSLPIDHERHYHPDTCAVCGAALTGADAERAYSACLVIDLRELSADRTGLEIIQTKQIYHEHHCECGHVPSLDTAPMIRSGASRSASAISSDRCWWR